MAISIAAAKAKLSSDERGLLQHLLDPEADIQVLVPAQAKDTALWGQLTVLCRSISYLDKATGRAKLVLGRMLEMIDKNPQVYQRKGFALYEDFLDWIKENFSIARSTCFEARELARDWGELPAEEYDALGPSKLRVLSKWTNCHEQGNEKYRAEAKKRTVVDLRLWAAEQGLITAGEVEAAIIMITTNKAIASEWREFVNRPEVQAYCGSPYHGVILLRAIQEASAIWLSCDPGTAQEQTAIAMMEPA